LTLLFTSTWRRALISLVPAAAGVLFGLGAPAAMGQPLTLCHITAAAVVFGLCVDYGIYMTHAIAHRMEERGRTTIVLTTATSVIGSGVLLFTQHPVLFALGLTLTVGMVAGHVTAIWGVPSMVAVWGFGGKHGKAGNQDPPKGRGGCRFEKQPMRIIQRLFCRKLAGS